MKYSKLLTKEGEGLSGIPWDVYPRPQMARREWLNLNGKWRFETESASGDITVPFCPECPLSGFEGEIRYGETLRYSRKFDLSGSWFPGRIMLNFGAVSRGCTVRVNGVTVGTHSNAYLPFSFDITEAARPGENEIEVSASNDLSPRYPLGKQKIKRGGMWYTPVSGIWQTVWLEPVPEGGISALSIASDAKGATVTVTCANDGRIECEGKSYPLTGGAARIEPENARLWSPDEPNLYRFTVKCGADEVESYFALRSIAAGEVNGKARLLLNGEPYFFHGLLDQGYFSDGLYTPAAPELYENDILAMKSLGFNTLRKHIKIEPELFYYYCDLHGMAVFQDMVNNGKYSFLKDTILPTVGPKCALGRKKKSDAATAEEFLTSMDRTVDALSNHPCVLYWTIFNEGWGQFDADGAYERLKARDAGRIVDSTSGWFHTEKSDVDSSHIYFGRLHLGKEKSRPQVLSEFGGYVWKDADHSFNKEKTYGYKIFKTREEFASALRRVYLDEVIPLAKEGLCASILTQVSDVEDETNGLFTYDRRVLKVTRDELSGIAEALEAAVKE